MSHRRVLHWAATPRGATGLLFGVCLACALSVARSFGDVGAREVAAPGPARPRLENRMPDAARAAYAKALSCYDELAFACAATHARQALRALGEPAPANLDAVYVDLQAFLAEVLVALGQRDEARRAFTRLLERRPRYTPRSGLSPRILEVFLEAREATLRDAPASLTPVVSAAPSTPLSLEASYAYAFLFGDDAAAFHHGSAGVFALAYDLTTNVSIDAEVRYALFRRRNLTQSRLELLTVGVGARRALRFSERVALLLGGGVGVASMGVRALGDATAVVLHASLELRVSLARTLDLSVGIAPGLVTSPSAGSSMFLPLRAGLAFRF